VKEAKTKFSVGWSLLGVLIFNIFIGISTMIIVIAANFILKARRKNMLKKDKEIRQRMNKIFSPFAQSVIINASKKGITID